MSARASDGSPQRVRNLTGLVNAEDCHISDANLVIVQVNLRQSKGRLDLLLDCLKILRPLIDIVAVQDPPSEFATRQSRDYDVLYLPSTRAVDGQPGNLAASSQSGEVDSGKMRLAGVGFYIHRRLVGTYSCDWWVEDDDNFEHVVTLHLSTATATPIKLHNVYNRNHVVNYDTLLSASTLSPNSILLGDFNLHHPSWGGPTVTAPEPLANLLYARTQAANMRLTTPVGLPTFHPNLGELSRFTTIDLCWVGEGLVTLASPSKVLDQVRGFPSDHHPIQTVLRLPPIRHNRTRQQWSKLDAKAFNRSLRSRLIKLGQPTLETTACIEQYARHLVQAIVDTIREHVPVITQYADDRKMDQAVDRELQQAYDEEDRAVHALLNASPGPASHRQANAVREAQRARSNVQYRVSSRKFRRYLHGRGTSGHRLFRTAKQAAKWQKPRESHVFPLLLKPDNTESADMDDSFRTYAAHMCDDIEWEDDGEELEIPPTDASSCPGRPNPAHDSPQSLLECEIGIIMDAICKQKSPGPDEVHNRALKVGRKLIQPHIEHLMRASIRHSYHPVIFRDGITALVPKKRKTDYSLASSWRPITLLSSIGKIMERVMADRLTVLAVAHGYIPDTQFARRGSSTTDALEHLLNPVYKAWCTDRKRRTHSTLLGLDVKSAYDHVDRRKLLEKLVEIGVPEWMIKWIASFLSRRRVKLRAGPYSSDPVWLKQGVPQGSPISPILFFLSAAEILKLARSDDPSVATVSLAFSDDINILVQSSSRQKNCDALVRIHEAITAWASPRGIHFDPSKYAVMHFKMRNSHEPRCTLLPQIPGLPADCLKRQMRVLGVIIDDELSWKYHIFDVISRVMLKLQTYYRLSGATWGARVGRTKRLYITSLRPMISFACPVWYLRSETCRWPFQQTLVKLLRSLDYRCLLWASGAMRGTSAMLLYKELQIEPLEMHLAKVAQRHRARKVDTPAAKALEAVRHSVFPGRTVPPNVKYHPFEDAYDWAKNLAADCRERSGVDDATWLREGRYRIGEYVSDRFKRDTVRLWQDYQEKCKISTMEPILRRTKPAVVEDWDKSTFMKCAKDLPRARSTMLIQLRSGLVSVGAYQASIDKQKSEACGCDPVHPRKQTAEHLLCHCPNLREQQDERISQLRHNIFYRMLSRPQDASITTKWAIKHLNIEQFDRARTELEEEEKQEARLEQEWV